MQQYRRDAAYRAGVENGFGTVGALNRFNQWVQGNIDQINPASVPVCLTCGNSDYQLCNCYVNEAAPVVEEDVPVLGVVGDPVVRNRPMWVGWVQGIHRMFFAPQFDLNAVNNHRLRGLVRDFDPSELSDDLINERMYCHIRCEMHTHYRVNGREDRDLRLEHCRKIAKRYCEKNKIRLDSQGAATAFAVTVQRACDQAENGILYQPQNPNWVGRSLPFLKAWVILFLVGVALMLQLSGVNAIAARMIKTILRALLPMALLSLMVYLIRRRGENRA